MERNAAYEDSLGISAAPETGIAHEGVEPAEGLKPAWRAAEEAFQCFVRAINILQVRLWPGTGIRLRLSVHELVFGHLVQSGCKALLTTCAQALKPAIV